MDNIVNQLVGIYYSIEYAENRVLTELEANHYYTHMLRHGRVNVYLEGDKVVGFIESWRLDTEQLGRVIIWDNFSALKEDVNEGPIAYISDMWVDPDYRRSNITNMLIDMFKESNKDADYFVSDRVKKEGKYRYVRVYDKENGYKLNKE